MVNTKSPDMFSAHPPDREWEKGALNNEHPPSFHLLQHIVFISAFWFYRESIHYWTYLVFQSPCWFQMKSILTVDGRNPAPPTKPWNDEFVVKKQQRTMVSNGGFRNHPQYLESP